jgi:predicted RNA-binding Zn-ribbon protein involved in translation (DUF1610 family)
MGGRGIRAVNRTNAIKISITGVLFLIGGILVMNSLSSPDAEPVATDARPVDLVCTSCQKHSTISYDDYAKAPMKSAAANSGRVAGASRSLAAQARRADFACPACGEKSAQPASKCPRHSLYYPRYTDTGANGQCPQCSVGG